MMNDFFIEDKNFLTDQQKEIINKTILGENFPFYWNSNAIGDDNLSFFTHIILKRKEERIDNETGVNTNFYNFFLDVFNTFCNKHNIKYNELLRIAVNLSFNNGSKKSKVHKDHFFEHKQLLIYLNDVKDKNSHTCILNEDKKLWKSITPEKYKAVCFGHRDHYAIMPKKGRRLIAVYTFN